MLTEKEKMYLTLLQSSRRAGTDNIEDAIWKVALEEGCRKDHLEAALAEIAKRENSLPLKQQAQIPGRSK